MACVNTLWSETLQPFFRIGWEDGPPLLSEIVGPSSKPKHLHLYFSQIIWFNWLANSDSEEEHKGVNRLNLDEFGYFLLGGNPVRLVVVKNLL